MARWLLVLLFVVILFALCGCSDRPDRVVLSQETKIEVVKPDPRLLEKSESPTPLTYGTDNGLAADVFKSNNMICADDRDKLESLQGYTITLLNNLKSKPDQVLMK